MNQAISARWPAATTGWCGGGLEVGFRPRQRLVYRLCTDSKVAGGREMTSSGHHVLGPPAGAFLVVFDERVELFLRVGELAFCKGSWPLLLASDDVIDMAGCSEAASAGLRSAASEGPSTWASFDGQHRGGGVATFGQCGARLAGSTRPAFSRLRNALFVRPKSVSTLALWLMRGPGSGSRMSPFCAVEEFCCTASYGLNNRGCRRLQAV